MRLDEVALGGGQAGDGAGHVLRQTSQTVGLQTGAAVARPETRGGGGGAPQTGTQHAAGSQRDGTERYLPTDTDQQLPEDQGEAELEGRHVQQRKVGTTKQEKSKRQASEVT